MCKCKSSPAFVAKPPETPKKAPWERFLSVLGIILILLIFWWVIETIAKKARAETPDDWLHSQFNVGDRDRGYIPFSCCTTDHGKVLADHEWKLANGTFNVLINGKWYAYEPRHMRDSKGGPNPYPNAIAWYHIREDGTVALYCYALGALL